MQFTESRNASGTPVRGDESLDTGPFCGIDKGPLEIKTLEVNRRYDDVDILQRLG